DGRPYPAGRLARALRRPRGLLERQQTRRQRVDVRRREVWHLPECADHDEEADEGTKGTRGPHGILLGVGPSQIPCRTPRRLPAPICGARCVTPGGKSTGEGDIPRSTSESPTAPSDRRDPAPIVARREYDAAVTRVTRTRLVRRPRGVSQVRSTIRTHVCAP